MNRRGGWVWPLVVVLLVAVPIFEVWLLIQVGQQIGVLATIGILVAEALLGAWLMKREGSRAWKALNEALRTGAMPSNQLADAALVLVGGVLLMLPGFVTDVVGFFFLLPFTRPLARRLLGVLAARQVSQLNLPAMVVRSDHGDVITGETVEGTGPERNRPSHGAHIIPGQIDRAQD